MKMQRKSIISIVLGFVLFIIPIPVFGFESVQINVDGIVRKAEVYIPNSKNLESFPVVFAFHGHGGTMKTATLRFHIEKYWPEAIVVYPQGLNTPTNLVDPEGKQSGWQSTIDDQSGRDIKFFDSLLQYLKIKYDIDEKRIYSIGFSNGGVFTYVLWAARGKLLGAIAPIAGILSLKEDREKLTPKPVFHVAGRNDPIVKFVWQNEMINYIRKVNECNVKPKNINELVTEYESTEGNSVVTYISSAGHEIPEDALPYIVKYFKEHELKKLENRKPLTPASTL